MFETETADRGSVGGSVRTQHGGAAIFVLLTLAAIVASLVLVVASMGEGDLARTDQADISDLETGPEAVRE